ncbi:unnamed protein product [Orchesella dallaii]|uniref:NADP-dependent oxidoreductase domain-containing protein n=1 Tax=Orchesella dallaii TaxID=48710 RepID=A0ABP1S0B2_9HEXA
MKPYVEFENGQKMPIIGYGMWQCDSPKQLEDALDVALEAGYRHFDTAYLYQNEDVFGCVLKKWFDSGKVKREELFIVTKLPPQGNHHERVENFLQQSLNNLQLTYVDLFLIHNPATLELGADGKSPKKDASGNVFPDLTTSLEDVWKALEAQVDAGKTKAIGLSNFTSSQVERVAKCARIRPANHQVELNAYYPKKQLRSVCKKYGISVCAFAAFGSPGRKSYYVSPTNNDAHLKLKIPTLFDSPIVKEVATKHSKTTAQILLRFLAQQGIVVLAKSVAPDRIKSNFEILDFELDADDLKRLDSLDSGKEGSWAFDWKLSFPGIYKHPEFLLTEDE